MSPDEITNIYETLASQIEPMAQQNTQRIGAAQAGMGQLAQAVMGNSQTGGIGNYTYNRLLRPTVDRARDQLIVQGRGTALQRTLDLALRQAQNNYQRAQNSAALSPAGTNGFNFNEVTDPAFTPGEQLQEINSGNTTPGRQTWTWLMGDEQVTLDYDPVTETVVIDSSGRPRVVPRR